MEGPPAELDKFMYSLSHLLPVLQLTKPESETLTSHVQLYFIFHEILGYVLASFVAAGMAGLTQKS
jgi:hypothetical protein